MASEVLRLLRPLVALRHAFWIACTTSAACGERCGIKLYKVHVKVGYIALLLWWYRKGIQEEEACNLE